MVFFSLAKVLEITWYSRNRRYTEIIFVVPRKVVISGFTVVWVVRTMYVLTLVPENVAI